MWIREGKESEERNASKFKNYWRNLSEEKKNVRDSSSGDSCYRLIPSFSRQAAKAAVDGAVRRCVPNHVRSLTLFHSWV